MILLLYQSIFTVKYTKLDIYAQRSKTASFVIAFVFRQKLIPWVHIYFQQ